MKHAAERDELQAIRQAAIPFIKLVKGTSGRIPTERLSASDWNNLCRAASLAIEPPNAEVSRAHDQA